MVGYNYMRAAGMCVCVEDVENRDKWRSRTRWPTSNSLEEGE